MPLAKCVSIAFLCFMALLIDPLEGTRWKAELTPDDVSTTVKGFSDVLVFKANRFSVEGLEKRGYKKVEYDADTRGITTAAFDATIESPTDGKMKWHGSVTATEMTGNMTWTKKDGSTVTYSFKADRMDK